MTSLRSQIETRAESDTWLSSLETTYTVIDEYSEFELQRIKIVQDNQIWNT